MKRHHQSFIDRHGADWWRAFMALLTREIQVHNRKRATVRFLLWQVKGNTMTRIPARFKYRGARERREQLASNNRVREGEPDEHH